MSQNSTPRKRLSRIVAFLLNIFLMPAGYVYAGKIRTGIFMTALALLAVSAGFILSVAYPPGLFAWFGGNGLNPLYGFAITACFGLHAAWLASKGFERARSLPFWSALIGLPLAILFLAAIFRAFWPIPTYSIPSVAGWPTLDKGDVVAVNGARSLCGSPIPKLGNLIVYKRGGSAYIKRVVAGAGDTISIIKGQLILNGVVVDTKTVGLAPIDPADPKSPVGHVNLERLANGAVYKTLLVSDHEPTDEFGPYRVPTASWFALGDNRDNSLDSRTQGPVPQAAVCGVAFKIVNARLASRIGQELGSPSLR